MVIRGKPRGDGKQLASYLLKKGDNEAVYVLDIRGTADPDNLRDSLFEMSLTSELSKTDKGLYHAQLNPAIGEDKIMTNDDWLRAADILEKELKLEGQKRAIVMHEKSGRIHAHVVWERYDHDKGSMIHDGKNFHAHDRARLAIEKELSQKHTPKRNAKRPDMKVELTELWYKTKTGEDFIKAAEEKGYIIAVSRERRPYRVVDDKGQDHDLVKQIDGVRTGDIREVFKEIKLPTKKQAFKTVRTKKGEQGFEYAQDKFNTKIERSKTDRAEHDRQQSFKDKTSQMKLLGKELVTKSVDFSQDKMASQLHHAKKYFAKKDKEEKQSHFNENSQDQTQKAKPTAVELMDKQRQENEKKKRDRSRGLER